MTRADKARQLFADGYNCAQAVVLAFADVIGADADLLARLSAPLGGGVARLREVCGAVSGMAMVIGAVKDKGGIPTHAEKLAIYAFTQEMINDFKAEFGSYICRELLNVAGPENPEPAARDKAFFDNRPCKNCVGYAAQLIEEKFALSD